MIDSVVVFAGLLIVRLIFAGISLAGGGAITGTDILFHYSLKDIILYALKVLYFIAFTYLTGTTLGKKAMNLRVVSGLYRKFFSTIKNLLCRARRPDRIVKKL